MTQELILNCTPVFAALKLSVGGKSDYHYYKSLFDEVRLENKYKVSDIYFLLENCPEWPAEENPC